MGGEFGFIRRLESVHKDVMRLAITAILCAVFAVVSGYARFGSGRQVAVWVDMVFLASTAAVVAVALVVIIERMGRIGREPSEDTGHRDD
jgi:hypothetical protein